METEGGFKVEVSSAFPGWWRYNVALMCGCYDAAGERIGFASAEDRIAEVGACMGQPPADYPAERRTVLRTMPCHRIELYLYVVPHTLPDGCEIADTRPFELRLRITRDGATPAFAEMPGQSVVGHLQGAHGNGMSARPEAAPPDTTRGLEVCRGASKTLRAGCEPRTARGHGLRF